MTPTTEDVPQFLTDEEWREFQAIPDQGYSHRHWVNHKIAKYAAVHDRTVKAEAWADGQDAGFGACENGGSYTANPYRIEADRG